MIKAILFDLDETLLNQKEASSAALRHFHAHRCAGIEWRDVEKRWKTSLETHFDRFANGEITFQEQRRWRIRDVFEDPGISDAKADDLFGIYLAEYERNYRLFPEVLEALERFGGYPLGVVSNGNAFQQLDKLKRMGIHGRFSTIVVSEAVGLRKPDPRIFELAARNLGVETRECLFVGDNPEADYRGSADAGMLAILLNRNYSANGNAPRQIASLLELARFLP